MPLKDPQANQPGLEVVSGPGVPDKEQDKELHIPPQEPELALSSYSSGHALSSHALSSHAFNSYPSNGFVESSTIIDSDNFATNTTGDDKICVSGKPPTVCGIPRKFFWLVLSLILAMLCIGIGVGVGVGIGVSHNGQAAPSSSAESNSSGISISSTATPTAATAVTSSSTTSAAMSTSTAMSCPQANGTTYVDPSTGVKFMQECYIDYLGNDIDNIEADTMEECASDCAADSSCKGAVWFDAGAQGKLLNYCWKKTYLNSTDTTTNGQCQSIARLN
ncbi:hypothetical protein BX600DRAFT_97845 [Xylariales sp. PMI_506]|nr:hypothetical protein BX600DRAFT_97845 [Xylariales sp. PMI_506]